MDVQPDDDGWYTFLPDEQPVLLIVAVAGSIADVRRPDTVLVELSQGQGAMWCHTCGCWDSCTHAAQASRHLDPGR